MALDRTRWNQAAAYTGSSFLQSWDWGEFQQAVGSPIVRTMGDNGAWVAQWVRQRVRFGMQLACYLGPIPATERVIAESVRMLGRTGDGFLHLELPYGAPTTELPGWLPTRSRQAPATRLIELSEPLDALRARLHPKTRYNINVAERGGVTVRAHRDPKAVERFLELLPTTAERHGIGAHAPSYYRSMADRLGSGMFTTFTADLEGRTIAANLVVRFAGTATYVHGASDYTERSAMAPHLLQWHQIRWAKEQGERFYDFGGVAPLHATVHPLAGISRFKAGFGGHVVESPGAFDLPLKRAWYTLYRAAKKIRG